MNYETDEKYLERKFSKFGRIEKTLVVYSHELRRSKGYGFITYEDERDAVDAVESMNGKMFDGREIRVDYSFNKTRAAGGGSRRSPDRRDRRRSYSRSPPRRRERSRDRR